jgi:hypothetical protein
VSGSKFRLKKTAAQKELISEIERLHINLNFIRGYYGSSGQRLASLILNSYRHWLNGNTY